MPVVSSIVSTTITAAPISPLPCSYFKNYPWLTPGSRGIMVPHLPVPGSTTEDNRNEVWNIARREVRPSHLDSGRDACMSVIDRSPGRTAVSGYL
jgi:hypothetical protein